MSEGEMVSRRRLAGPEYRALWTAVRDRLERTELRISNRPVGVEVAGSERVAIAGLLGLSPAGDGPLRVRLDRLDELLRGGAVSIGLVDLLTELDGPVLDRTAARRTAKEAREKTWASLAEHPVARPSGIVAWLAAIRSSGLALRLAGSPDDVLGLVRCALEVLGRLPARGLPLAVLASEATGDSHALDRHRSLGVLVAGALPGLDLGQDGGDDQDGDLGASADRAVDDGGLGSATEWRRQWAMVGVVCDDLSVSALVLNLPVVDGDDLVASMLEAHRRSGEPLRLTLHQLERAPLRIAPDLTVRLCENPSVVRAAVALGPSCAPLICTEGQPDSAVDHLISRCRASGASIVHHGDFDWGGLRIATTVAARHGVGSWRFGSEDYLAAASMVDPRSTLDPAPSGIESPWDRDLVPTMQRLGMRIYEEQVLDDLLADLSTN